MHINSINTRECNAAAHPVDRAPLSRWRFEADQLTTCTKQAYLMISCGVVEALVDDIVRIV